MRQSTCKKQRRIEKRLDINLNFRFTLKYEDMENTSTLFLLVSDNEANILSDWQLEMFHVINFVTLCGMISLFGIAANIINIIIFYKQGFKNSVNISFIGMAISDLLCLLALLWVGVCLNPLVAKTDVPWIPLEFQYLTGSWPHITCGRITSYITVYITAERCLCIIFPLKVKQIITPRRTTISICVIYFVNIVPLIPEYSTLFLEWKIFPFWNRTLLSISYTSSRHHVEGLVFFLHSIMGLTSFLAVVLFTTLLIIKLKRTSEWRREVTSGSDDHVNSRDKKTMTMIATIACILIVCYTPGTIISMTTFVLPDFYLGKRFVNICAAMWSFGFLFQAINSSVNIFLYYRMSSVYRSYFGELFYSQMKHTGAKRSTILFK